MEDMFVFLMESYNFKEIFSKIKDKFNWKSKSDTEVLLNSFLYWGDQFVKSTRWDVRFF